MNMVLIILSVAAFICVLLAITVPSKVPLWVSVFIMSVIMLLMFVGRG
jgi:hypothetical protein